MYHPHVHPPRVPGSKYASYSTGSGVAGIRHALSPRAAPFFRPARGLGGATLFRKSATMSQNGHLARDCEASTAGQDAVAHWLPTGLASSNLAKTAGVVAGARAWPDASGRPGASQQPQS